MNTVITRLAIRIRIHDHEWNPVIGDNVRLQDKENTTRILPDLNDSCMNTWLHWVGIVIATAHVTDLRIMQGDCTLYAAADDYVSKCGYEERLSLLCMDINRICIMKLID